MASITFKRGDEYALKLARLAERSEDAAKKAIYAGAKVLADNIKRNLDALPTDTFRRLNDGEKFDGLPEQQKQELANSFGITPIALGKDGFWNAKVGFDGYGGAPTKKYPHGLPNQLVARAIESGSSVRVKHPFVAPAVRAGKKAALQAMQRVIDEETQNTMEG